ncbi:zinc ribbon domain-containing protein [Intestinibacillus massiliensis]
MNYEVVTLDERTVVGIGTRTGNDAPDMMQKIGKVWQDFMGGGAVERIPGRTGDRCYGLYYNYTWDDNSYDMLAAWGADGDAPLPEGFQRVTIPGGQYAKFSFRGDVTQDTGRFWGEVWQIELPRAYRIDFEEYICEDGDEANAQINIYIGLADICQSCGMPMTKPEEYGTEADGSRSAEYCVYCMEKGAFTADCTMEQMIETCLDVAPKIYTDREKSREMMLSYFPTLKRWRK